MTFIAIFNIILIFLTDERVSIMNYYLKFHMYGTLDRFTKYFAIDTINFYSNEEFITVTKDNIVSHDFEYRTGNLELIFSNQSIGNKYAPYGSTKGYSDLIIRLDTKIDKMDLVSYQNTGSCKYIDICQSTDNVDYTLLKTIEFSNPSEKITLENIKILFNQYLIYENNRYYNIKDENYDILEKKYVNIPFSNDLVTLFKENSFPSLSELSEEKNISGETFKPLDKFSNFKIKKLVK